MQKLTVTLVTLDAADCVSRALESVRFADERLVVDGGSSDGTVEVCHECGARVLERQFDGFGAQRQFALEQASHPWVFSLDADEQVSPGLERSIRAVLASPSPSEDAFSCSRLNFYRGRPIRGGGWHPDRVVRMFARDRARWSDDLVHESILVEGRVGRLHGSLLHHPYRDLDAHVTKVRRYARLWARDAHARGRRARWVDLVFRPIAYFIRRYVLNLGIRDGTRGLLVCGVGAFYVFLKYAMLEELAAEAHRSAAQSGEMRGRRERSEGEASGEPSDVVDRPVPLTLEAGERQAGERS